MDVDDKASISNAVEVIGAFDGKLDVLVNKLVDTMTHPTHSLSSSAGIIGPGFIFENPDRSNPSGKMYGDLHFNEESFDEWKTVLSTNTIAPFFVTMGFLGLLEKGAQSRSGATSSVITISSTFGRSGHSNNVVSNVGTYMSQLTCLLVRL